MNLCLRAALVCTFLVAVPGLVDVFEAPKTAAVRTCGLAALGIGLASLSALRRLRFRLLDLALLAWLTVELLATVFSVSPRISLFGDSQQNEGLFTTLGLAGLYLAARLEAHRARRVRGTLDLMFALAAAAGLYALLQAAGLDRLPWKRFATYGANGELMRPFAFFGHPSLMGAVGAASLAAAAALAALERARRWRLVLVAALLAAATLVTLSRGAWLGAVVGLGAAATLAWRAHPNARAARVGGAAAIGAVALLAVAVLVTGRWRALLVARFAELLHPGAGSAGSRLEIWRGALAAWRERPWLGHGTDTFELVFPRYQPVGYWRAEWGGVPFHAHSIYLQTLATRGALGVAAGLFVMGALSLAAVAAWRRAGSARGLVAALIAMLAALAVAGAFGALGVSAAVLTVFAAGTLASWAGPEPLAADPEPAGPSRRTTSGRPAGAARPPGGRAARAGRGPGVQAAPRARGPLLAGGALALVSLLAAGVDLESKYQFQRGLDAFRRAGSPDRAAAAAALEEGLAAARRAVAIDPRNDALECLRANVCLSLANVSPEPLAAVEEAEAAARRAIELEPRRALDHFTLAWALLQRARLGDSTAVARAEAAFARGLDLAPANGLAMMQMAQNELVLGRPRVSLEIGLRLAALYPAEAGSHLAVGHGYLALRDSARARDALLRALGAKWRGHPEGRERIRLLVESLR